MILSGLKASDKTADKNPKLMGIYLEQSGKETKRRRK
jgi:hypothetical protein